MYVLVLCTFYMNYLYVYVLVKCSSCMYSFMYWLYILVSCTSCSTTCIENNKKFLQK